MMIFFRMISIKAGPAVHSIAGPTSTQMSFLQVIEYGMVEALFLLYISLAFIAHIEHCESSTSYADM